MFFLFQNCESLARARDHVRQKILEHAQLDESSSEPGPRLTRVKFGGREEFVVPVEGQSEGSLCSDNSHTTRHDTRQQAPSHDSRSDMRQQSPSDTSQRAPSSTSHCTSSDGQHTTRKACQYTSKDTTNCASQFTTSNASQQGPSNTSQCTSNGSQHTKNNTNQHATNNTSQSATNDASQHTSDISQQALSHTSQSLTSISSRHAPSNVATCRSRTKQADTISRPEERAKSLSDDRRDACTLQSSSVVSHDPVDIIGESQRHADNQSKKDVNGIPKCSAGSSHVTHDVSDAVVNSGGVDMSTAQVVPNKELAPDRMPNNQELSVENLETVDRRTVLLKSVDVSSGYRAHDVDSNEFNESCAEYSVLSKEDGILSADVNSAPTTCGQKDTLAANNDHTMVRNKSEIGYCGSSRESCGNSCGKGEGSFDVETSSQSQPLIALIVNNSQSATVVCGANSSDSNLNASGVPTVSLRKVRKRKSDGHHNDSGIRRRSSRLRSMSSNETSCPLSSGTDTQDLLLNSKVGTSPADTLSSLSRHALKTGSPSQSQSSVEASHGRRGGGGAKRGRKSRKVETSSSHEYNTRSIFRRNPCSQESSESTFNNSSQWSSSSARSLMPDVGLLLSSPSTVKDIVYFSLPDDEYGSLKLQIAKRKALRQSNGSPRDLATKTDSQVSDGALSRNSRLEAEKANSCIEIKEIAVVKSDVIIEQDNVQLVYAGLGMKSCDHRGIVTSAQEGALMANEGPFLLSDNSPVMYHSLQGARHCRNVPPKTRSRSQDENVANINVRKNKSSRQRKKNARSFVQTMAGSSQEDIFQSDDSSGGNRVQTRRNISQNLVSRDASVDVDTASKDGQLGEGKVPPTAVVSTEARTVVETCDSISHAEAAIAHVTASVCNVQHQKEASLSSGTSLSPHGHGIVSTMHAEEGELPHPSIASSCTMHRNVAAIDTDVG